MKKYDAHDYWLFRVEQNAIDYYVVEDVTWDFAIIVDWDLSDEEEKELIRKFNDEELDFYANGGKWKITGEIYADCVRKVRLDW